MNVLLKDVLKFYGLTLIFSWTLGILIIQNVIPAYFHYLTSWGPMIASLWMYRHDLIRLKKMFQTKISIRVLFIATFPLWLSFIIYALFVVLKQDYPNINLIGEIAFLPNFGFFAFFIWLFSFGLGEEVGWRGYLYPRLKTEMSSYHATVITALMWIFWHLPYFFYLPSYQSMSGFMLFGYFFSLFFGTFFIHGLFDESINSLLIVILWHALYDFISASSFGDGGITMILSIVIIYMAIQYFKKMKKGELRNV